VAFGFAVVMSDLGVGGPSAAEDFFFGDPVASGGFLGFAASLMPGFSVSEVAVSGLTSADVVRVVDGLANAIGPQA
jgi:hypothetical protein